MSIEGATKRAALAVHRRAEKLSASASKQVEFGAVQTMKPVMQVELFESAEVVELDSSLRLTDQLRWWDANFGIQVGDTLVMAETADHTWLAFGLLSERDAGAGVRPLKPPSVKGAGIDPAPLDASSEAGLVTATSSAVPSGGGTPVITVAWSHSLTHKMEVYDETGARIGWVPVFADLP